MIRVEVVYSPAPGRVESAALDLPPGALLGDALRACAGPQGWLTRWGVDVAQADTGVWGRRQPETHRLRDGDRVEIYRPLQCDPKEARRRRQQKTQDSKRTPSLSRAAPAAG